MIIDTVSIPSAANVTSNSEEIITGVCTFGECPVLQPTKLSATFTTEPANDPLMAVSLKEESVYSQNTVSDETETIADNETTESVSDTHTMQTEPVTESHGYGYIGTFYITAYTAEEGFPEGSETASGYGVRSGYCAMNLSQMRTLGISYGDKIRIEGSKVNGTYTVMDCGCDWGVVDIWVYSDAEAYSITGNGEVYFA